MNVKSRAQKILYAGRVHIGFLGTAFILILMSLVFGYKGNMLLSELSWDLGMVVVGVTVIESIWRMLGGDPLSKLIDRLLLAIPLLESQQKFGIRQFYANRGEVTIDRWIGYIKNARQVDMAANTLRQNWTSNDAFIKVLEESVRKKRCRFRFLTLCPGSSACVQRAREEEDKVGRLAATINDSLLKLSEVKKKLKESDSNGYLQLRAKKKGNIYCSIIRIDDKMLVTFYLSNVRGRGAPTWEIHGEQSTLFQKFLHEFEKMWETSSPWPP